ncbi:MAG: M55 family metallopeptidase [Anaerolineae bacterium]|nr:M55 family metallopeptidase [Anaerolineae bacterium]
MKVFVAVDMEGIAGLVQWDGAQRDLERRLMTEEVNAAVRGAFAGGATEVLAGESHGNMRNLLPDALDPRASFLSGQPKPMNHMAGVDSSFDLALFVGYHSKAGTLHGVMAHTFAGSVFSLSFNGVEVGEIGADAALCGSYGVPVGLVAGDRAACEEARSILGGVRTVAVKEGLSRSAARCLPVARAREMIETAAADAVRQAETLTPFTFDGPVWVEVVFVDPSYADTVEHMDFVTRVDGRTIRFAAEDYRGAFERFSALHFLAPVVR